MLMAASIQDVLNEAVLQRARGAYLGLAIGDALGATVEFMLPREIQAQFGVHDQIRGGGWLKLPRGHVTDDTTMALALGEAILVKGRVESTAAAKAFDEWMRQKPVDIGNTVRRGIQHYRVSGQPWVQENPHDAGNGACMRVLPVALATLGQPPDAVREACRAQAWVTHHNPLSDAATECVVLMIQAALQGTDIPALLNGPVRILLNSYPEFGFRRRRRENPSAYIVETLQAVLQALFDTDDFHDCLVDVVNRGGDADTTGAIAGMIAGAHYGEEAIPLAWLRVLDERVRQRCQQQAEALLNLSNSE